MKFRIAMLLLALAAILVAAGCNDSNYSADAADSTKAVETIPVSTDADIAAPAENPCVEAANPCAVEGEGAEKAEGGCACCAPQEEAACTDCASKADGSECADCASKAEGKDCGDCEEGEECGDCEGKEKAEAGSDDAGTDA